MGSKRWRRNRRLKCDCGGYWFPHRKGGGLCYHNHNVAQQAKLIVRNARGDVLQAFADAAFDSPGIPSTECPF